MAMSRGLRQQSVALAVASGVLCAALLLVVGTLGQARPAAQLQTGVLHRQQRAGAAAGSRGASVKMNKRHLSRLAEEGAAEEGAAGPQAAAADPEAAAADPEAAAESLPCGTWPHLPGCVNQTEAALGIMPEDIQFECGGSASGRVCLGAAESCIDSAEYASQRLYAISQFTGVESRTRNVCKCFSSNGCRPACNVAVYTRWSATAGINCPANPPTYLSETGVYQYGDPEATYVAPEDYSFDNYPEYPNPAGHSYSTADARSSYEAEPAIGYYQRPLTASYKSGYDLNVLASGTYNPYGAVDTPRYDNDLEEATKPGGYGAF